MKPLRGISWDHYVQRKDVNGGGMESLYAKLRGGG